MGLLVCLICGSLCSAVCIISAGEEYCPATECDLHWRLIEPSAEASSGALGGRGRRSLDVGAFMRGSWMFCDCGDGSP